MAEEIRIGPHLLGRHPSPPDARDYRVRDILPQTRLRAGELDALADMTVRQIVGTTDYLSTWRGILAFWRWLKGWVNNPTPPQPSPTPTPDPTPTPTPIPTPTPVHRVPWGDAWVGNQGNTGHCTAFGSTGLEDSDPNPHVYDNAWAHDFYYFIKTEIDGVPRDDPAVEDGSYVRSAAKALAKKGLIGSYAFATFSEIGPWLQNHGPVVLGTDWDNGMFDPDNKGFVYPDGNVAGGHCFLALGYDDTTDVYTFVNSWGTNWANGGFFYMHGVDLKRLFARSGSEALVTLDNA